MARDRSSDNAVYRRSGTPGLDLPSEGFDYNELVLWQARDNGVEPSGCGAVVVITAYLGLITLVGEDRPVPLLMVEYEQGRYLERLWTNLSDIRRAQRGTHRAKPYVQTMAPGFAELLAAGYPGPAWARDLGLKADGQPSSHPRLLRLFQGKE